MDDHELCADDWNPYCDYVSGREELVSATLNLVLEKGVVVLRATPQVGKTILLTLLGRHILFNCPSLEPVLVYWMGPEQRNWVHYRAFLEDRATLWRKRNALYRPCNPKARLIYLIDEAQNSYTETDFWSEQLKRRFTRSNPLFVLVCVYGSTGQYLTGLNCGILSEAIKLDQSQRIELRRTGSVGASLLFTFKETMTVVKKWAIARNYNITSGVAEYIQTATDGHPGMVGLVLLAFDNRFPQVSI